MARVATELVLVPGDPLPARNPALGAADTSRDLVVMAEVAKETTYVRHHPRKIAFGLAARRISVDGLRRDGWNAAYTRLDDSANTGSIARERLRQARQTGARQVVTTRPGAWQLIEASQGLPLRGHAGG